MERIIFVPIEQMEERYSSQWFKWSIDSFIKLGIKPIVVGSLDSHRIEKGEFLDVVSTHQYKLDQMLQIIKLINDGFEGTIFFMDLWFPSIEIIGYLRDTLKKNIRIKGILHAGTWDKWDYLTQSGMGLWVKGFEDSLMQLAEEILVATDFHKQLILKEHPSLDNIRIVKFPVAFFPELYENNKRENRVIFPHRLSIEKSPEFWEEVKHKYLKKYPNTDISFVRTKDVCNTKKEYYKLMSESKVVFSSALQETFGIAMLEGVNCGCIPVAPDRLSYQETLKGFSRYQNIDEAVNLIHEGINNYTKPEITYFPSIEDIISCLK